MSGHVGKQKLANGKPSWYFVVPISKDPETGKWKRKKERGFERERDAKSALDAYLLETKERGPRDERSFEHLCSMWLAGLPDSGFDYSGKTLERYQDLSQYAVRMIGSEPIQELDTLRLQNVIDALKARGGSGRRQGKPLSAKTVREIASVMNQVFKHAVRMKAIRFNPMLDVQRPRGAKKEPRHFEVHHLESIAAAVRGHEWLDLLIVLDSATGCRRGELLALEWPDIDLKRKAVTINKSLSQTREAGVAPKLTKNRKNRTLTLPAYAMEALKKHRARQEENRKLTGGVSAGKSDLVFSDENGDYLKPDSVSAKVSLLMRKLGLPAGHSLHTVRHTVATHLLAEKVPLPAVSKRLGHGNTRTTAGIYSHALEESDSEIADVLGAKFGRKLNKKNLVAPRSTTKKS
jgi:integrase